MGVLRELLENVVPRALLVLLVRLELAVILGSAALVVLLVILGRLVLLVLLVILERLALKVLVEMLEKLVLVVVGVRKVIKVKRGIKVNEESKVGVVLEENKVLAEILRREE
jgi:hypothetical protein